MKVFVTGVSGQVGRDVICELQLRGHEAVGTGRKVEPPFIAADITNEIEIKKIITEIKPDAVIHCAAWTAVDAAEEDGNKIAVRTVNADSTRSIAHACREIDCKMVYISTDYVFDGQGDTPWSADCKDYKPLNHYGRTKLEGELAVSSLLEKYFIVRTSWVYGENGSNFVKTMLRLSETHSELRVVNDQIGRPTFSYDLARLLVDMIETDIYGYYHASNEGEYISWADFAKTIFEIVNKDVQVIPISTAEYGGNKAIRPYNSRLDTSKLSKNRFEPLPEWKDALARYLNLVMHR